ncbi:hypothetical protein [Chamaesiphon sp. OTE_20_metabat_361]|uniref:DUF7305 domain-containing protein n=1 Tax=Chamaesiphon sp. OTE_20_metabat_361 TaxID=2964689 RepID=UPI00286A47CF|nr:hypothetical protein [Chamaesiphon sp. OTE_20_metabat_361]
MAISVIEFKIINKFDRSNYRQQNLVIIVKYFLVKIQKSTHDRPEAGFATPLALGMGLVTIIVAASLIGRSQSDTVTNNSQREIDRALSVSEAGIARFQSFLDRHRFLATKDLSLWSNTIAVLPSVQTGCHLINLTSATTQASILKNHNWIDLDPSDPRKGRYKIVDYQYQNGIGKLTIAGEISRYNNSQNIAKNTLLVKIPVGSESAKIAPPALWANTFDLHSSHKITGQVRGVTCPQLPAVDADGIVGIGSSNIAIVGGIPGGEIIADPFIPIPPAKTAPNTAISISAVTSSIKFPRPGDLHDANNEYHYLVDIDNFTSNHSIKLQDPDRIELNVAPGQKVNLYLKGNIDLAGSQTANVNSTHPNLRIYGSPQTLLLTIKDTASITAFIHAPFANVKSISAAPANPSKNITGAVWVNSWDSMTSPNNLPIIQMGDWADFGIAKPAQPSQLSPISSWQRVEG